MLNNRIPGALSALLAVAILAIGGVAAYSLLAIQNETPIPVKVVVVTMFETGEDTGDAPGEFQLWNEGMALDTVYRAPYMDHDIHMNVDTGVMGVVTGMGTAHSASSVTALGLDTRFDFSRAYWLVAGISGFDPEDGSIGSVAWARYVVDADLAHDIDIREAPDHWRHGRFPLFSTGMGDRKRRSAMALGEVFQLNGELALWAYRFTQDMPLHGGGARMAESRARYRGYPAARKPPQVMMGDQLSGQTYWHGQRLNEWANEWVDYWTDGDGEFVSSAMEDTGTYRALSNLDNAGRVQVSRLMVLRAASNYTFQPAGVTAYDNLAAGMHGNYESLDVTLKNLYEVGAAVVNEITGRWAQYE